MKGREKPNKKTKKIAREINEKKPNEAEKSNEIESKRREGK